MKKSLLVLGLLYGLFTTIRAQVYSDVVYFSTACAPNTSCTGRVLDPLNVADSNQTNFASIENGLGVGSSVILEFGFSAPAQAGALVGVTLQKGNQTLSAGLLSNITVQLLSSGGTVVAQKNGLELQDLGLLGGTGNTPAYVVSFYTPQGTYDIQRVRVTLGGVLNVLNDIRVYNAFYLSPATNGSGQVCGLEYATNLVSSGCSGLLCSVPNPDLAVDTSNYDDYGLLNIPVGLLGFIGNADIRVSWDTPGDSGQYVGFIIGQNNMLLNLALLSNINITLHDALGNVVHTQTGFSTVDLTLLSGSSDKSIIGFYAPVNFVSAQIQLNQLVGLLTSLRVYGAIKFDATPDVVQITSSPYTNLCNGDSVILSATPGYDQYFWSNGATGPSITVSQSGTYSLTALDQDACLYYSTIQPIQINALPVQPVIANIMANPTILCNGDSSTISVVSPFPPTWSTGETDSAITLLNSGTYTVSVTDTNGCVSTSDTLTIITDVAQVSITSTDSATCDGTIITLIAAGTGPITWSTGDVTDTLMVVPATDTVYTASVVSTYGCTDSASVNVIVQPLPPPPVISGLPPTDITLCNGATQTLSATISNGVTPIWNTGDMTDSIEVSLAGDYYVTVVDSNGCFRASDTVSVLTDTALVSINTATGDTATCFSATEFTTLIATANGNILWSTGDTTYSIQVMPTQITTYTATATTGLGCMATDTFTLVVHPLPLPPTLSGLPQPGADTLLLCNGATVDLSVNTLLATPIWSTGDTTSTITVGSSGTYFVTLQDPNGCKSTSDTINVAAETALLSLVSADSAACAGNPIAIVVTANGLVIWNDGSSGTAYFDTPTVTTTYTATVTSPLECQDQLSVTVMVSDTSGYALSEPDLAETEENTPAPVTDVGANDTSTGNASWLILDGPFFGTATINGNLISYVPNENYAGMDSLIYVVCGSNACGTACDTNVFSIRVNDDPTNNGGGPTIKIPQGLSPNGDGNNDSWVIDGLEDYPNNKLTILNRWGDILYKAEPYNNDWSGGTNKGLVISNNAPLPDGTYYYVLILDDQTKPLRGFIEVRK